MRHSYYDDQVKRNSAVVSLANNLCSRQPLTSPRHGKYSILTQITAQTSATYPLNYNGTGSLRNRFSSRSFANINWSLPHALHRLFRLLPRPAQASTAHLHHPSPEVPELRFEDVLRRIRRKRLPMLDLRVHERPAREAPAALCWVRCPEPVSASDQGQCLDWDVWRSNVSAGLYTDESPGLKVDPVVVLVLSLVFIFSVVALHSKAFPRWSEGSDWQLPSPGQAQPTILKLKITLLDKTISADIWRDMGSNP